MRIQEGASGDNPLAALHNAKLTQPAFDRDVESYR